MIWFVEEAKRETGYETRKNKKKKMKRGKGLVRKVAMEMEMDGMEMVGG